MDKAYTYQIKVREQVNEVDLNATSPVHIKMVDCEPGASLFIVCTDQSGLIGLMRHLHRRGFVILSFYCQTPSFHLKWREKKPIRSSSNPK